MTQLNKKHTIHSSGKLINGKTFKIIQQMVFNTRQNPIFTSRRSKRCSFIYNFAIALYLIGNEHYQICVALQWIISSVFSFFNQKVFVFCTKGHWLKEYFKCCTTWVVSYACNALILELIVKYISKNVYLSQLVSIFIASVVTYVLFKYFAFKHKKS